MRLIRGSIVVGMVAVYLGHLFRVTQAPFWQAGLGDWLDPHFINYLLEHWHDSLSRLGDPSSPPMFYPVPHTLGYSHSLVLYAPFYLASRVVLHPFQAYNLTVLLVMAAGSLSLYGVLRKGFALSFFLSLLLVAGFLTSPNVTDGAAGIWSQRASVFLVPIVLLAALTSARMAAGATRSSLAGLAGLLAVLLFAQEFYTAIFSALLGATLALPVGARAVWRSTATRRGGVGDSTALRTAHEAVRPVRDADASWGVACGAGAAIGVAVFLWFYLGAYREHQSFPEGQLLASLVQRPPIRWHTIVQLLADLRGYPSLRPFVLTVVVVMLAWSPWARVDMATRLTCLWWGAVALVVLALPFRFGTFSIWREWFAPLPGFAVVRDPKRIIYVYELAVVCATAGVLPRLSSRARGVVGAVVFVLLVADWNPVVYDFQRPNATFTRWVERDILIDPACRAFYVAPASPDYDTRPHSGPTLHALDAMFIALVHGIPTLNGYSAWTPPDWALADPREPGYLDATRHWIDSRGLQGVCALDIEARTMTPRLAVAPGARSGQAPREQVPDLP